MRDRGTRESSFDVKAGMCSFHAPNGINSRAILDVGGRRAAVRKQRLRETDARSRAGNGHAAAGGRAPRTRAQRMRLRRATAALTTRESRSSARGRAGF